MPPANPFARIKLRNLGNLPCSLCPFENVITLSIIILETGRLPARQSVTTMMAPLICLTLAAVALSGTPPPGQLPFLFMDLEDVGDRWGMMWPEAKSLAPDARFRPPLGLHFDTGATVVSVIPSRNFASSKEYEIYASNTTGWEPLMEPEDDSDDELNSEP